MVSAKSKASNKVIFVFLVVFAFAILYPLLFILNNSFKGKFYISKDPFSLPTGF